LHRKDLPGTPDLAFIGKKKAIFVHGCFWHRHPGCKRASIPKTNTSKWEKKFNANVLRDKQVQLQLSKMGWQVLVIWQCETKDKDLLNKAIKLFLCEKHD
jgi:DNA mismatch endonuclease (patch repair protein)